LLSDKKEAKLMVLKASYFELQNSNNDG
jgi:hypothetical protein